MKWRVTIWRSGTGCGFTAVGRTRRAAYDRAIARAGDCYLAAAPWNEGRDIRPKLDSMFSAMLANSYWWRTGARECGERTCSIAIARESVA
jgi:hypothetical protein